LKIKPPIGIRTIIREVTTAPWIELNELHPLQPLKALKRVEHQQQVCVSVVVAERRDPVSRETATGPAIVCNSLVQQGDTQVRCAFWRDAATALGSHDTGACLLMYQVVVKHRDDGWELTATDATTIQLCSEELAEQLKEEMREGGTPTCITQARGKDWSQCAARPCSLSALITAVVPGQPRKLTNVYFLHNLQVMGITAVRQDSDAWFQRSCVTCKRQAPCEAHADAPTENRWLLKLLVADSHAKHEFVVYHDHMLTALPELSVRLDAEVTGNDLPLAFKKEVLNVLRSQPWSMKVTFRENEYSQSNELECRLLTPTMTLRGEVLDCLPKVTMPIVVFGNGCPFASPPAVSYDKDLGIMKVSDSICASSVRMFVRVSEAELPDDEACVQDPHSPGLRVRRLVHSALVDGPGHGGESFVLAVAGLPSAVNWLNRAIAGNVFFVVAMMTSNDDSFFVNWHAPIAEPDCRSVLDFAQTQYHLQQGRPLEYKEVFTPSKRIRAIEEQSQQGEEDGTVVRSLFTA
jgi:hypothetical protein